MNEIERLDSGETRYRVHTHPPEKKGGRWTFSLVDHLTDQCVVERQARIKDVLRWEPAAASADVRQLAIDGCEAT